MSDKAPAQKPKPSRVPLFMALGLVGFVLLIFLVTLNSFNLPWSCAPGFDRACMQEASLRRVAFQVINAAARQAGDLIP